MVLKDILQHFHNELDALFGKEEVDSFFGLLMAHYLDMKRIQLVLEPSCRISKEKEYLFFEALRQLKAEQPIQYILGETEFYGLPFKVNKHTLIPRPETEELVDWIIQDHSKQRDSSPLDILDIGTGSGCIAISLAKQIPNAKVEAIDISEDALNTARQNAECNEVIVNFMCADILNIKSTECDTAFHNYDVIVSNPPYVRNLEKAEIKPNVLKNEPHLALFVADENPLQFYKAICEFAQMYLKHNGSLYFEINEYLGKEMVQLMKDFNFKNVELKQDLFGKDRMVKGFK